LRTPAILKTAIAHEKHERHEKINRRQEVWRFKYWVVILGFHHEQQLIFEYFRAFRRPTAFF